MVQNKEVKEDQRDTGTEMRDKEEEIIKEVNIISAIEKKRKWMD